MNIPPAGQIPEGIVATSYGCINPQCKGKIQKPSPIHQQTHSGLGKVSEAEKKVQEMNLDDLVSYIESASARANGNKKGKKTKQKTPQQQQNNNNDQSKKKEEPVYKNEPVSSNQNPTP